MANRPRKSLAHASKSAHSASSARYELVFEKGLSQKGSGAHLVGELGKLRERSGEAIGAAYARFARWFLGNLERLEDANAERRRSRRKQGRARNGESAHAASLRKQPLLPSKRAS
jgi:hypothetical protein